MTADTCTGACGGEPDCDACEPADGSGLLLLSVLLLVLFLLYIAVTR